MRFFLLYTLDGQTPVPCENPVEWAISFTNTRRHVGHDTLDGVRVSTVFLGVDHNHAESGPPILFETMVFVEDEAASVRRYATWAEAEAGHRVALDEIRLFQQHATEYKNDLLETIRQQLNK